MTCRSAINQAINGSVDWWDTFDRCMTALRHCPTDGERIRAHRMRYQGISPYAAAAEIAIPLEDRTAAARVG